MRAIAGILAFGCAMTLASCDADSMHASDMGELDASDGTAQAGDHDASLPRSATPGCGRASSRVPCHDDPDPCGLNSGFQGDEYCLLPPPPGQGVQLHFGPKDHNDPAEIEKYLILPGEEFNAYAIAHIPTTEDHYYGYVHIQMRSNSHHLINTLIAGQPEEGYMPEGSASCDGTSLGGFPGTQNLVYESPPGGQQAPENEGLGRLLPGNSSICHNHHTYNFTDEPQLRELWINVWFMDESEVTQQARNVVVMAGPWEPIPPGAEVSLTATADITGEGRILSLFGHRHAWTERFFVELNDQMIYDSWDWEESTVFNYDSVTDNPPIDPEARIDGAVSGVLEVKAGDQIRIQCDIKNGSGGPLPFRNALYDGEMCILFGASVGTQIGPNPRPPLQ